MRKTARKLMLGAVYLAKVFGDEPETVPFNLARIFSRAGDESAQIV